MPALTKQSAQTQQVRMPRGPANASSRNSNLAGLKRVAIGCRMVQAGPISSRRVARRGLVHEHRARRARSVAWLPSFNHPTLS
eukprot:6185526-Pleurochrysis_carterae.AAC.1